MNDEIKAQTPAPQGIDAALTTIKKEIRSTKQPKRVTVRSVLGLFGYQRRGVHVTAEVERKFAEHGLQAQPHFSVPYVDAEFVLDLVEGKETDVSYDQLIARIGHLTAANQSPRCVKRDEPLGVAMSAMLEKGYSQLPVMPTDRKVDGFVSWTTIGEAHALGVPVTHVRDCMESGVQIVDAQTPLTDAIDLIVRHDFVMVRSADGRILGPVTTTDLSQQYHVLAEPFLLIGQIESSIRKILDAHAPLAVLKAAKHGDQGRKVERPEDLSFSEYKAALGHDEVWPKLGLKISKSEVMDLLERVRVARNDVMHFHPDDGAEAATADLKTAARMLDKIARAAVPRRKPQSK